MSAQHPVTTLSKGIDIMTKVPGQTGRLKSLLLAASAGAALLGSPAFAQDDAGIDPRQLIEQMVAENIITREQADRMISNARAATVQARAQAPAPLPQPGVAADGTQTVTYVSPVVREQIAQHVRAELGTQAQAEGWARPGETPEWTRRIQLYGDVRVRGEARRYDDANGDIFWDYGAINGGQPQNVNASSTGYIDAPFLNTLEDRQRFRLRARLGVKAQITDWITADIRLATGASSSPVSTNQTMGADGSGKYHLWLDRASIRLAPTENVALEFGRFANPLWTSDLVFDNDMNFDGVAISGQGAVANGVRLFGTLGAFPVFNTDLNFGTRNAPTIIDPETGGEIGTGRPFKSEDRYLFAAQAGVEFNPTEQLNVKLAGGYYHFDNIAGRLSEPCYWTELVCSTDALRPAFQQHGNTMMALRDPLYTGSPNPELEPDNQYFGLASKFELLHIRAQAEYRANERFGVRLEGDFVKNLGWDRDVISAVAWNNLGPNGDTYNGGYDGGDTGWQARLTVGSVMNLNLAGDWQAKRGDWNAWVAYRRLESDAVVDAFADSDFHIGGTNNRGWQIGGNYAIARNTILGFRWLSAEEIASAPFSVDRGFIDLMTRF
ncbi:MAG: hypothetical protein EP345_06070 [Sphingomonadales bacterium]|uniref:Porin n=2 Tax=Sphingomonadales TaxID=204457 RepID=A0A1S1HD02_9SPHN|nr:hypothetical protein BHE75_02019 [Sphingomonas haloaromaticamans]TNE42763.1 MAG: hypothetical protein EP345_06070 [Sphingomonadales bacterium]